MTTTTVKVKGTPLSVDGKTWIFAPISLGAVQRLEDAFKEYNGGIECFKTVVDAAYLSLKRNYEITREQVADMIYTDQMHDVMAAVMSVSGLTDQVDDGIGGDGDDSAGKSTGIESTPT